MAGKAKAREANEHHRPGRWLRDRAAEDELASINHGLCANPAAPVIMKASNATPAINTRVKIDRWIDLISVSLARSHRRRRSRPVALTSYA
jgi:hypothetical protein